MRYSFRKYADDSISFDSVFDIAEKLFSTSDALVLISSAGIAVRAVGKLAASKTSDPAVICIDEGGNYVIPLLSGHLGKANALSAIIAERIGAQAVITTATDVGGKFSPDSFADANGLIISDMALSKEIAAAVLNGEKIGFFSSYPVMNMSDIFSDDADIGISVGTEMPFAKTLKLLPRNIVLGVGCRRDTDISALDCFVRRLCTDSGIDIRRISIIATIDIKRNEPAINALAERLGARLVAFSAEELMAQSGDFSSSEFVFKTTGADNVCERSSAAAGGTIIVNKTAHDGMTAAVGELPVTVDFDRKQL